MGDVDESSQQGVERTFDRLAGELDYPMFIVTVADGEGRRAGCLVGFATQCSIKPPRLLVCVSKRNETFSVAQRSDALAVHFVGRQAAELVVLFGGQTGDELDKFAHCRWRSGPRNAPILEDCPRWLVGEVVQQVDFGDHVGFVLAPVAAADREPADQFPFQLAKRISPGHPA